MATVDTLQSGAETPVLKLNDQSLIYLYETSKWGQFLSIMGFIGVGLVVLIALCIGSVMNLVSSLSPTPFPLPTFTITLIYLFVALLYFFPVFYLYRFSTKMKLALEERNEIELASSFSNLKSLFKFMGAMTIVVMSIYLLIFIVAILAVIARR